MFAVNEKSKVLQLSGENLFIANSFIFPKINSEFQYVYVVIFQREKNYSAITPICELHLV